MTPAAGEVHVHMRRSPARREPAWEGRLAEGYIMPVGNHWYWNRYFSQKCTVAELRNHIGEHHHQYNEGNNATDFRLLWPDGRSEEYPSPPALQFLPVDI